MALYPKIQSPCPYKGSLSDIMDGDVCRLCKREVFDLTAMSDEGRTAFLAGCKDEVCVTYKFPVRTALAAAAIAAAVALPTMAAACEDATGTVDVVVVGGIKDPKQVEYVKTSPDVSAPELPVVYEDDGAKPATPPAGS